MAILSGCYYLTSSIFTLIFALLLNNSYCFNPKLLNVSNFYQGSGSDWSPAGATWYGSPTGAGSNGGACGYTDTVERPPYSSMVSAAGSSIYQFGDGCGVCYQVKCTENQACSGNPVTVTITDQCPGCPSAHFDLSGTAFGAIAKPGQAGQLRDAGVLNVQYKRINCNYPGVTVEVRVDPGSNPSYFASTIEYVDGEGIKSVKLKQQSGEWIPMEQSWGAVWELNPGHVLQPPFSLQLVEAISGKTLILNNVIPRNWNPGQTYRSHVNFNN
ncbi:putative expansin-B2 [Bienertia sinuspersici]